MSSRNPSTLLTYANVQMAAEALRLNLVTAGQLSFVDALTLGNNRSSKFTPFQAQAFAGEWAVVDHLANTGDSQSGLATSMLYGSWSVRFKHASRVANAYMNISPQPDKGAVDQALRCCAATRLGAANDLDWRNAA